MVAALALASGTPAPAQTAVEYGGVVSQNRGQGGAKLGSSLNKTYGSVERIGGSSHKRSKGKR
jgi:hypothetical protein